jgi:GR25 family glycosyltransferase involved in LPS biosynthesis
MKSGFNNFWLYLLLVLSFFYPKTASLFAGIEKHFKKIEEKKTCQSIKNIDFIYVINLDQRPEKLFRTLEQLKPYNIAPYRFSAVNGWELSLEVINDIGIKLEPWMTAGKGTSYLPQNGGKATHEIPIKNIGQTYFSHCMSRGAIGIVLSHLSILQDAYDSGYETIWVMEDDIDVIQNPHTLSDLIDQLDKITSKNGWDILFTDQDTKGNNGHYVPCYGYAWRPNFQPRHPEAFQIHQNINHIFRRVGARYGVYSMIVKRSGMKKILDFMKTYKIFLPYDMEFYLAPGIRIYALIDDVVSTILHAPSDNGGPNYIKKDKL